MELKKQQEGNKLIVSVSGRLDTNAAPIMMKELEELLVDPVKEFELDMGACDSKFRTSCDSLGTEEDEWIRRIHGCKECDW